MEWLKKVLCSIWFYVGLIFVSLIAPFVINGLYKFGQANNVGYVTLWEAKDVLAFWGSYISFFGTIVLGAVAVFQTDRANNLAEKANNQANDANDLTREALAQAKKANELALQMQRLEQSKFYSVVSLNDLMISTQDARYPHYMNTRIRDPQIFDLVDAEHFSCNSCYHVDFIIKNESEYPIDYITVKCKGRFEDVNYGVKEANESTYVAPNDTHNIRVIIPTTYFVKYKEYIVTIDIFYQNIFGYETHVQIKIDDLSAENNPKYTYQFQRISNIPQLDNTEY